MDILSISVPWILRMAIDNLETEANQATLAKYALLLIGIAIIQGIFTFLMRKILVGLSRKIEYSLRVDLFSHLQSLDSSFFVENKTGSIMAILTNDLDAVRTVLGPGILNLFNTIFVFISTLTIMLVINYKLTLYALIAIPVLPFIVWKLSSIIYERSRKSQEQYASLSARTQESIAGIKVVKSFTQEENELNDFLESSNELLKKDLSLAKIRAIFWPVMILTSGIGSLVVLLIGGRQVINGEISIGEFVQFSAYITSITWPLISLGWVLNIIQRGAASMGRINEIFNKTPEIKVETKAETANVGPFTANIAKNQDNFILNGNIKFENVYFYYPKISKNIDDDALKNQRVNYVLKNINFEINNGATLGITGFTGSGKTTLVNLIPRLYDSTKGKIFIDNKNIKNIPLDILRQKVGFVSQEPFIFSKTISENIIFGKEEVFEKLSKESLMGKIMQVSKIAMLHKEITDFPYGYDTIVGERGVTLSGGQKQRLAIARALITKPKILILDDSFSNIDTQTEELILQNLKLNTPFVTKIIISHRISTIKKSDFIIVLDNGEIAETGTNDELIKKHGIYKKLYLRQKLSTEIEDEVEEI